jgi:hypothetical protein
MGVFSAGFNPTEFYACVDRKIHMDRKNAYGQNEVVIIGQRLTIRTRAPPRCFTGFYQELHHLVRSYDSVLSSFYLTKWPYNIAHSLTGYQVRHLLSHIPVIVIISPTFGLSSKEQ